MALDEKLEKGASILFDDDPLANMIATGLGRGATALGRATKAGLQRLRGSRDSLDEDMPMRELPERYFPSDSGADGASQDWSWLKDILSSIASDISSIRQHLIEQSKDIRDDEESERLKLLEDQLENKPQRPQLVSKTTEEEQKSSGGLLGLLSGALSSLGTAISGAAGAALGSIAPAIAGGVTGIAGLAAKVVTAMPIASVVALVGGAFLTWWKLKGADDDTKGLIGDGSVVKDPKLGNVAVGPKPEDATFLGDAAYTAAVVGNKIGLDTGITDRQLQGLTEGVKLRELRQRMADNQKSGEGAGENYWNQSGFFSSAALSDKARSKIFGQLDALIGERLRQDDLTRAIMFAEGKRKSTDLTKPEAKAQSEVVVEGLSSIIKENIENLQKEYAKIAPFKYDERKAVLDEMVEQETFLNQLKNYNEQLKNPENDLAETVKKINKTLADFEKQISGGLYGGFGDYGRGSRQINLSKKFAEETATSSILMKDTQSTAVGPIKDSVVNGIGNLTSATALGMKRIYTKNDGSQEIRMGGTRAWRNNNPGNIEYGPFAKSLGAIGSDGRFAIFPTYEQGRMAKEKLIFEGKNYQGLSLSSAIYRYAPPTENNSSAYLNSVLAAVGGQNKTMSDYTPEERQKILSAMQKVEGFRAGQIQTVMKEPPSVEPLMPMNSLPKAIPIPLAQPNPAPPVQVAMAGGAGEKQSAVQCSIDGSVRAACS